MRELEAPALVLIILRCLKSTPRNVCVWRMRRLWCVRCVRRVLVALLTAVMVVARVAVVAVGVACLALLRQ
jgi:hypothetical protein